MFATETTCCHVRRTKNAVARSAPAFLSIHLTGRELHTPDPPHERHLNHLLHSTRTRETCAIPNCLMPLPCSITLCTLYPPPSPIYTPLCTLSSPHSILYTLLCTLYSLLSALYSPLCSLYLVFSQYLNRGTYHISDIRAVHNHIFSRRRLASHVSTA